MTDDMKKYKEIYLSEARTHVKGMNLELVQWEKHPRHKKNLQNIFRMAHTLKSMSASMGYEQMAKLSHSIEDLLDAIRDKHLLLKDCVDLLFACFDALDKSLKDLSEDKDELDAQELIISINNLLNNQHQVPQKLQHLKAQATTFEKISSIEVKVERLDKLLNLTKELLVNKMRLETISESIQVPELTTTVDILNRTVSELQYHVMQIRLVPFEFVFNRFIRMVRDIGKQQNKDINLEISGGKIEVDRSLIDEITEALAHLIKNAIDHGLETPKERLAINKSAVATIELFASREKDLLVIEVRDDGRGLNIQAIKNQAIKANLVAPGATKDEVIASVFQGLSTTSKVTDISGRGLGLSIVKQKIEFISGSVEVSSEENQGTTFTLKIPLTLAVIFVLLIKQANNTYAIPLTSVDRLTTIPANNIKGLMNHEAMVYDNTNVPLIRLSTLYHTKNTVTTERVPVVILRKDNVLLGLIVDELLTTEEIITQPISALIKGSKLFSGTALLGSGETILILDVEQIFLSRKQVSKA